MTTDYTRHWDDKFSSRAWGRYPPEDLVRFMGRNFRNVDKASIKVLEVGCGPGANVWFFHREGFSVHGIDASPAAITIAQNRLTAENSNISNLSPDLRVGNFTNLPWPDKNFDVVVDIFAIYANTTPAIVQTLAEIHRVLKPDGLFYSKLWGTGCTGYGEGTQIEDNTFDDIPRGPCRDMGISHFFTRKEISEVFCQYFRPLAIDTINRSDDAATQKIEEFHCQFANL